MKRPEAEWFADREYWDANREFIWSEKRVRASGTAAGYISKLLRMKPGEEVLDLACGFGRHSLALAASGYSVTGVDLDPGMISEATDRAREMNIEARFLAGDMREFLEPGRFHHIIIMYNSFGYFEDAGDDAEVIANCYENLRPGGRLLLQATPREFVRAGRPSGHSRNWYEEKDGGVRLEESEASRDWTWNTTRWILIGNGLRREYSYGMRLYSSEELLELLAEGGFSSVVPYGDLGGKPYVKGEDRLTITAVKP